jgi:type VI secretion system protein ImpF
MRPPVPTTRLPANIALQPSIIDRLVDQGPDASARGFDIRQLMDTVRRDLEDLLNTRCAMKADPEAFPEVADSIVLYGMPDMALVNAGTTSERDEIGRVVEAVIARHEPRLREVKASLVEGTDSVNQKAVNFHIQAKLAVDPSPEVSFETVLELMSGHASVKSSEGEA